jgi:hypothetical protein
MNLNKMAENVKKLHTQEAKNRQVHLLLASLAALLKRGK